MPPLRSGSTKLENREFSTSEVAAILGMRMPELNNLIDELARVGGVQTGSGRRNIEHRALTVLLVAQELTRCNLAPALRKQTLALALATRPPKKVEVPGTNLSVLIAPHRRQAQAGLKALHEAEAGITMSGEILQGEPVVRGTRVPAYTLAAIANAHGVEEARQSYPFLTLRQIEHALLYALAHPRKGRPKRLAQSMAELGVTPKKVRKRAVKTRGK